MSGRLHVVASFDTREALLEAMRLSVGWVLVDEPELLALLSPHRAPADEDDGQQGGGPGQGEG